MLALSSILFAAALMANETERLDQIVRAIVAALPPEWKVVEKKGNEIPYGHHWDENYGGPRGTLLVVKGTRPVNAEFSGADGTWKPARVATEALEIWLMPSNYNNSALAWLSMERPIQPVTIVGLGPIKVYARQWALLLSKKDFDRMLGSNSGVRWPDPQVDSPEFLTWKDWKIKLQNTIDKEVAK